MGLRALVGVAGNTVVHTNATDWNMRPKPELICGELRTDVLIKHRSVVLTSSVTEKFVRRWRQWANYICKAKSMRELRARYIAKFAVDYWDVLSYRTFLFVTLLRYTLPVCISVCRSTIAYHCVVILIGSSWIVYDTSLIRKRYFQGAFRKACHQPFHCGTAGRGLEKRKVRIPLQAGRE